MIKRIIFLVLTSLLLVGCGVNCKGEPPKRAIMHNTGAMGMAYHYTLYKPLANKSHSASFECTDYSYFPSEVYTDNLGTVDLNSLIWKNLDGDDMPIRNRNKVKFIFSSQYVTINGLENEEIKNYGGRYKIEISSPDSWGIPIEK